MNRKAKPIDYGIPRNRRAPRSAAAQSNNATAVREPFTRSKIARIRGQ
jgi:hypothetical protein